MLLIRKSSSRKEAEEDDADQMKLRYHECVEEIKTENAAMGSLQLHNEAMRRLKQRQSSGGEDFAPDEVVVQTRTKSRVSDRFGSSLAKSLRLDELTLSLHASVDAMRRKSGSGTSYGRSGSGPLDTIISGRRGSAMVEVVDQEAILSSPMFQDIELSDSDESGDENEEASSPPASQGEQTGGSRSAGRRRSLIRRTSSLLGRPSLRRMRSRRSSTTRRSSQSSISHSTNTSGDPSQKSYGDKKVNRDEEKTSSESGDESRDRKPSAEDGGGKAPVKEHSSTGRRRPRARAGRRRSSLFSVDERRASINEGNLRASIGSIGESLKGSFSGGPRRGSLICGFHQKNSLGSSFTSTDGDDNSLICGWERRQSVLSNSVVSIQDELFQEDEEKKSNDGGHNESLICGWDPAQSAISQMSIQEDELLNQNDINSSLPKDDPNKSNRSLIVSWNKSLKSIHSSLSRELSVPVEKPILSNPSVPVNLKEEVEQVLKQAKESCTLFDVRKEKDGVIC